LVERILLFRNCAGHSGDNIRHLSSIVPRDDRYGAFDLDALDIDLRPPQLISEDDLEVSAEFFEVLGVTAQLVKDEVQVSATGRGLNVTVKSEAFVDFGQKFNAGFDRPPVMGIGVQTAEGLGNFGIAIGCEVQLLDFRPMVIHHRIGEMDDLVSLPVEEVPDPVVPVKVNRMALPGFGVEDQFAAVEARTTISEPSVDSLRLFRLALFLLAYYPRYRGIRNAHVSSLPP
jgi:hypothetical protein